MAWTSSSRVDLGGDLRQDLQLPLPGRDVVFERTNAIVVCDPHAVVFNVHLVIVYPCTQALRHGGAAEWRNVVSDLGK